MMSTILDSEGTSYEQFLDTNVCPSTLFFLLLTQALQESWNPKECFYLKISRDEYDTSGFVRFCVWKDLWNTPWNPANKQSRGNTEEFLLKHGLPCGVFLLEELPWMVDPAEAFVGGFAWISKIGGLMSLTSDSVQGNHNCVFRWLFVILFACGLFLKDVFVEVFAYLFLVGSIIWFLDFRQRTFFCWFWFRLTKPKQIKKTKRNKKPKPTNQNTLVFGKFFRISSGFSLWLYRVWAELLLDSSSAPLRTGDLGKVWPKRVKRCQSTMVVLSG